MFSVFSTAACRFEFIGCPICFGVFCVLTEGFSSALGSVVILDLLCLGIEEMSALLNMKGIRMHRTQSQDDIAKKKLYAAIESKKRRQSEQHVLRKEMA